MAHIPNPKRVAAGRKNQKLQRGITPAGRKRLRELALKNKPWLQSTGPKSEAGRLQSAINGRKRQTTERSAREVRAEIASVRELLDGLAAASQAMQP